MWGTTVGVGDITVNKNLYPNRIYILVKGAVKKKKKQPERLKGYCDDPWDREC